VGGITRLNAPVHLPQFVLDLLDSLSLFACSQPSHDVVISLDNALWDVASAASHNGVR